MGRGFLPFVLGFLLMKTIIAQSSTLLQPSVTLIDITSSSATFSVNEASGSLPVEHFIITLRKTADSTCAVEAHVRTGNSSSSTVIVEGLREHTVYSVSVTSIGLSTTREDFNLYLITTLTTVPSVAPSNLRDTSITSRSVILEWNVISCEDRNGLILSYDIQFASAGDNNLILTNTGSNTVQFTITGLTPFTSYNFSVAGVNINGTGPFSMFIGPLTTSEDVPGPVSGLIGTTTYYTVDLVWSPPDMRNGVIQSYIIQYRVNGNPTLVSDVITTLSEPQNYTISGLNPGSVISDITLSATTRAGTGTSTTFQSTFMTFRQPPVVSNIELQALAESIVRVSWDRVSDAMVTEYLVYYHLNGGLSSESLKIVSSSNNFTDIVGLSEGTYTFEVVARSVFGEVLQSNRSASMTLNVMSSANTIGVSSANTIAVTSTKFVSTQASTEVENLTTSSSTTGITITAIVVFIVTVLLYTIILAITILIIHSRRKSKALTALDSLQQSSAYQISRTDKKEVNVEDNSTYEVIPNKYEIAAEGLEMSDCVAYGQVSSTNGRPISRKLTPSITMPGGNYEDYTDD